MNEQLSLIAKACSNISWITLGRNLSIRIGVGDGITLFDLEGSQYIGEQ